jgi:hypothetical protein
MRSRWVLTLFFALHACCTSPRAPANPGGEPPGGKLPPVPQPQGSSPTERARAFLDAQLASVLADTLHDHSRLLAHFDPEARVLGAGKIDRAIRNLRSSILAEDPHDEVLSAKIASLVAGGNDRVVWLQFELAVEVKAWESGAGDSGPDGIARRTVRGSELITAESGWKAIAAEFSTPREPEPSQPPFRVDDPTEPGPLTGLAADPELAARAVRDDPAVAVVGFGPGDRAIGPVAARALLGKLGERKPVLLGKPRELRTADWGLVHANLDLPVAGEALPARAGVQLIALPDAKGAWSVVGVHYTAL